MDTSRLAELLKGAKEDYSQLANAYPNAAKFVNALRGNIEQNVPTQADFQNPQAMADWSQAAALNAPMGLAIKASHGSPHKFSKFDLSHLGTGEGAQMYGHGLYFGEGYGSPVAMQYVPRNEKLENKLLALSDVAERRQQYPAMEVYDQYMLNKTPESIEKLFVDELPNYSKFEQAQINNALNIARDAYQKQKGSYLYDVDLKWPDPAREASDPLGQHHLLDWDKPLSEQPYVQKAMLNSDEEWKTYASQLNPTERQIAEDMVIGKKPTYGDEATNNWKLLQKQAPELDHNIIHDVKDRLNPNVSQQDWIHSVLSGNASIGAGIQGGGGG